jgi:hypothetical protein
VPKSNISPIRSPWGVANINGLTVFDSVYATVRGKPFAAQLLATWISHSSSAEPTYSVTARFDCIPKGVGQRMMVARYLPTKSLTDRESVWSAAIQRRSMNRVLALKIVLALVGLLFVALSYPMVVFIRQAPALSMQFSLYVTLGVFLLLAIRNPSASRSVIAFTAWSSFAHAALMGTQACRNMVARGELIGVAVLVIIGVALIALAPSKQLLE